MTAYPTPDREGHYWAKLKLADNPDLNSVNWEVVQVFDNLLRPWSEADIAGGECQLVLVPGFEKGQLVDAFVWGPPVLLPEELGGGCHRDALSSQKASLLGALKACADDLEAEIKGRAASELPRRDLYTCLTQIAGSGLV